MRKRIVIGLVWLALAGGLYFFENGTGTRAVLACSLLLPLVPPIRRSLFAQDVPPAAPRRGARTVRAFVFPEAEEPGEVRAYVPGDPVNRIHWKLSAKRDELLVRDAARTPAEETAEEAEETPDGGVGAARRTRRRLLLCLGLALTAAAMLFALPDARRGAQALAKRLFDASEAVNAYAYTRFDVAADQPVAAATVLLSLTAAAAAAAAALSGSRWLTLGLAGGCALFQMYFGLAFPAWANAAILALLALQLMGRPRTGRGMLRLLAGIGAVFLAIALIWPGTDATTEAASERARDALSRLTRQTGGAVAELPDAGVETRHVHTRTLTEGEGEAAPGREYRLVTEEEKEIAMPHWVDWLRIILLLLLTVAVVVVPFLPFLWLNARRKKARALRDFIRTGEVREAVCAAFRQAADWLEATGNGGGNRLYTQWEDTVSERIDPAYGRRFDRCAELFEEAAYSGHEMREEDRRELLDLLSETGTVLLARADRRQRLRLRYRENLWT